MHNYYSTSKWTDIRRVSLENNRLLFGVESPTFGPLNQGRTIISRGISTVSLHLNFQIQVNYTLITAMVSSPDCLNADPSSTAPPPRLEYRVNGSLSWTIIELGKLLV